MKRIGIIMALILLSAATGFEQRRTESRAQTIQATPPGSPADAERAKPASATNKPPAMRPVAVVTDKKGYKLYSLLWQAPDGGRVPWLKLSRDEASDRLFAQDLSDPPAASQIPGEWTNNWKIVKDVAPSTNFARDLPARRLRAAERAKAAASGQWAGSRRNYPPPVKIAPLGLVVTTNGRYFSILWKDNRVDEHTAFTSREEAERALKSSRLQPPPGDTIPGAWTNRWTLVPTNAP